MKIKLQAHHHVTFLVAFIMAVIIIGSGLGLFYVIHHYELKKGSPNLPPGDTPPQENSKLSDQAILNAHTKHGWLSELGISDTINSAPDDMVSYNPNNAHPVFSNWSQVQSYLKTHPGIHGILGITKTHYNSIADVLAKRNGVVTTSFFTMNARTQQGLNCLLQIGFSNGYTSLVTNATNGNCGGNGTSGASGVVITSTTHWAGFTTIALFNRSGTTATPLNGTDTPSNDATYGDIQQLVGNAHKGGRASLNSGLIFGNGFVVAAAAGGPQAATLAGTATANQITETSGTFTFTNLRTAGTTITGAMLLNNTKTPASGFAEAGFTGVPVASTDTIAVTWTIAISAIKGIFAQAFVYNHIMLPFLQSIA